MAPEELLALESLVRRRLAGEPVAYLTGRREFWSIELEVTPDVLVPRPETELLVERALEVIAGIKNPAVLDLGTGSGAIAIAIAAERPDAAVTATDVSAAALGVAKRNAAALGLRNLRFLRRRVVRAACGRPLRRHRLESAVRRGRRRRRSMR